MQISANERPRIGIGGRGLTACLAAVLVACGPAGAQSRTTGAAPRPSTHLQAAASLMQQGHLAEGKAEAAAELEDNPSSVEAYNLLGIIATEQQDYTGANADFGKALQLAPGSARTHNNLGNLDLAEKRPDLAMKEFRNALRLDPGNRDANYNLGMLLMAQGTAAEAIPYLERVRPADRETRLSLVEAYLRSRRAPEALRLASALSAEAGNDFRVHFSLGELLAAAGQYRPAQLEFEKADTLQPHSFEVLFGLGQAFLLGGDATNAELPLTRALALRPQSPQALYLLGQAYWKESRALDALDVLVRAHDADPRNTDILLLMARVSMAQGYYADAIPLLESGVRLAPQRADLHAALGESYFRADQKNKAVDEFRKAIDIEPSLRSYAFLGLAETDLGRFDAAKRDFQSGLRIDPHSSFCLFNLGYIAERQGDTASAAATFERVLRTDPKFSEALLELARLRMQENRDAEAEVLLTRYVRLNRNPAPGYYRLSVVERKLHKTAEADRDLAQFQALSQSAAPAAYRYEDLFHYLDHRSNLAAGARNEQDLSELLEELKKRPDQPEILYSVAQAYLRAGNLDEARSTIAHLDEVKAGDARTLTGAGVLFARFRLYEDAIRQFDAALQVNARSDETRFDLANALFRKGQYTQSLEAARQVSEERRDDAWLALLADIDAHLGETAQAEEIERSLIARNPDNDQNYLSLALLELRKGNTAEAGKILLSGQSRVPASGKILWGLGLVSVLEGETAQAEKRFEQAVDLLPEWPGSYSMLGVFYFQTGQIGKAREVLARFRSSNAGGLDISRIEQVLAAAPSIASREDSPMPMQKREQLLQFGLLLVDRTL